jgi:hypothetical protein
MTPRTTVEVGKVGVVGPDVRLLVLVGRGKYLVALPSLVRLAESDSG